MPTSPPLISVIVPTHNRPDQLAKCLASLTRLDYPRDRFEVIVVDDGSPASLETVADSFRHELALRLLTQPQAGPGAARNTGLAAAQGEFVAFTADDCAPATDWLQALANRFRHAPDRAVGGRIVNALPDNPFSTATHLVVSYLCDHYNADADQAGFFTPNNLSFPIKPLRELGGFLPAFLTGEDRELCHRWIRHGYRMTYAPEVVVEHTHPLGFRSFCQLHFRYGQGSFRFREACSGSSKKISFEPSSFYLGLMRYPFSKASGLRAWKLVAAMGVAQVTNALGFIYQWRANRYRSR